MESRLAIPTNESPSQTSERLVEHLRMVAQCAKDTTVERAKAADKAVRDHPYQSIGLAVGLGLLIGLVLGRKWSA